MQYKFCSIEKVDSRKSGCSNAGQSCSKWYKKKGLSVPGKFIILAVGGLLQCIKYSNSTLSNYCN